MRALFKPALFVAICTACVSANASAACPGSSLSNDTIADATQVVSLLDCKAPSDSPSLSGSISINSTIASTTRRTATSIL
jgi:hypothetical protein